MDHSLHGHLNVILDQPLEEQELVAASSSAESDG